VADSPDVEAQSLTRNCNEALILAALRDGPKHGYQLALDVEQRSAGAFQFQHGTLYPILHKLEKGGLIRGKWSSKEDGRRRKSYVLTAAGRRYAARQLEGWHEFIERFLAAVRPAPEGDPS
jgi:DNA-binding PadR family transcriptional regulator